MPHDPEAFADMVVLTVKASLAPVLERLAAAEQCNRELQTRMQDLVSLRDRMVVVETKAATAPQPPDLGDVRDRLLVLETKAAAPTPAVTVTPPAPAIATDDVAGLRDRLVAIETKAALPHAPDASLAEIRDRLLVLETKAAVAVPVDLTSLRERVAVLEVRPPVPGPQGEPGTPGKDGHDGAPGTAGLSFEGVYQEGKSYELGHLVTWGGSSWHCNEPTTTKPGDGSKAWTLMVKRGRDGKDGRDGHDAALPVLSVGRTS